VGGVQHPLPFFCHAALPPVQGLALAQAPHCRAWDGDGVPLGVLGLSILACLTWK